MSRISPVSDSIDIAVDPLVAYEHVSDVTQMGRWSPENLGATVPEPDRPAHVGMTFVGYNRRGPLRWRTWCTVTAADPGRRFAFRVHTFGLVIPMIKTAIADWAYDFQPVAGGTRVTETWTDGRVRWPDAVTKVFDPITTRRRSFADFQRDNINRTLRKLKAELEQPAGS
jgi:hypothetical protein